MMHHPSWPDTHALITSALKQVPGERERFLRRHCADQELCERLIALVKAREAGSVETMTSAPADDGVAAAEGTRVGPYIVLHRLGRGGMGEVYLGRDSRLDRKVALKCLFSSREGGEELHARVIREARAAAQIAHAHVASVHDVIEYDGRTYIVMEYVEGQSLAAVLRRGALPTERVITIGLQLAGALAAAHGGGIIHRDLKPSNIQVMPDGDVKILDFGVALALASRATATTRTDRSVVIQRPGVQPGTPAYMSPEQLLGLPVDERSDLFSLALVLFEMATGRRPYASSDPLEMLAAAATPLPRADGIDRRVPRALADLIARGLAPDARDRFQTAGEMSGALEAVREELLRARAPRGRGALAGSRAAHAAAWVAGTVIGTPAALWVLGRLISAGFNTTLERSGPFAWESSWDYVSWGAKSLAGPAGFAVVAVVAFWSVRFAARLAALSPALDRRLQGVRARLRNLTTSVGFDDPLTLAQGLAALGIAALALVFWRFYALIAAWSAQISTATPETLLPLAPGNSDEKVFYRAVLTWLLLAFTAGFIRVIRLRLRRGARSAPAATVVVAAIIAVILLLAELPYRTLWQSKAERIEYGGQRCYVIGASAPKWLVYCPDIAPPRNRVVDRNGPEVRRSDVSESIFTPRGATR